MEILENTRNELFKRNEIVALVESEKNPDFSEMKKQISEQTKKPEENIDVHNIKGGFGSKNFKINAEVYDSKEDLEKNKVKTKKQRDAEAKGVEEVEETKTVETKEGEIPTEDKPEQIKEEIKTEDKPEQAPAEDKAEEENKEIKEKEQGEEESKEP
jgi:ribosomal protein S24E